MNKDQIKGRLRKVTGSIKEAAGKVTGDKSLERKGRLQKAHGKVRIKYGDIKSDINDAD